MVTLDWFAGTVFGGGSGGDMPGVEGAGVTLCGSGGAIAGVPPCGSGGDIAGVLSGKGGAITGVPLVTAARSSDESANWATKAAVKRAMVCMVLQKQSAANAKAQGSERKLKLGSDHGNSLRSI